MSDHRHFGLSHRFAPVSSISSASAGAMESRPVAPAHKQTARQLLGGIEQAGARHGAGGSADRYSFPPLPRGSIQSTDAPLERLNLSETVKDIAALAFTFLFLGSVSIGFAVSMFLLFFCDLR